MQKIILVGKPNVGKSSLFNRLAGRRIAITSDVSGTTRDTNKTIIEIYDKSCVLIDSGGLDDSSELFKNVKAKTLAEARSSDAIIFMVDGKMMPSDEDKALYYALLKLNLPTALVINKVDSKKDELRSYEFANFGDDGEVVREMSAREDYERKNIQVGIIGRVNVGKSSLLNALVKESRAVVSDIAGTTIDPVNETFVYEDRIFEFVDTAGIRKRGKIEGIEKYALNRTESALELADIALLVLDSSEPLTELDERIAGLAAKFELGVIIVLNKWDKSEEDFDKFSREIRDKFKFLAYAPIISVSALGGKRVHKIYPLILEVYKNYTQKIQTARLNEAIEEAVKAHPIPREKGKSVKIYYAVQFGFAPPKIALVMNRPRALHFSYKRYLTNKLREKFELSGTQVVLIPKNRSGSDEENEGKSE